jgi:hypothetical protein
MKITLKALPLFALIISINVYAANSTGDNPTETTDGYKNGQNLNKTHHADLGENANYENQEQLIKFNADLRKIHGKKSYDKAVQASDKVFYSHPEKMTLKDVNGVKTKFYDPATVKALEDYKNVASDSPGTIKIIEGKWTPYQSEAQNSNATYNNYTHFDSDGTFEQVLPPSFKIIKGFWSVVNFKPLTIKIKIDKHDELYDVKIKDFKTYYTMKLTATSHSKKTGKNLKNYYFLQKEKSQ